MQVIDSKGGRGVNRTPDTRIFRESNGQPVSPCNDWALERAFRCVFGPHDGPEPAQTLDQQVELATAIKSAVQS